MHLYCCFYDVQSARARGGRATAVSTVASIKNEEMAVTDTLFEHTFRISTVYLGISSLSTYYLAVMACYIFITLLLLRVANKSERRRRKSGNGSRIVVSSANGCHRIISTLDLYFH